MSLSKDIPEIEGRLGSAGSDESGAFDGDESPRRRSGPALAQPDSAATRAQAKNDDSRWLENRLRNENRWPRTGAEELEQRLRRRTIVLGSALVLSGLIGVTAVGVTVVRSPAGGGPEPSRTAAFEPAPPAARAAGPPSATAAGVEPAFSGTGPPPADRQPAAAQGDQSGGIDRPAEAAEIGAAAEQWASGPAQAGSAERLKRLREAAQPSGNATTAPRSAGAPVRQQPAQVEQQQQQATASGRDADVDDSGELRTALAATKQRVEELETAKAEYEARIAELRSELADSRAEARTLDERLAASRRGIERLNTVLATATATGPAKAGTGGSEVDREAAGAGSRATAPAAAAVDGPAPGTADDEASTGGGAAYYTTAYPVNLRAGPRNAAEVLAVVELGDVVRRIGRERGWLQVTYTARRATAVTGWMHSRHLRPVEAPPQGSGTSAPASG